jgi:hypothetical protein
MKTAKLTTLTVLFVWMLMIVSGTAAQSSTPRLWLSTESQQVSAGQAFTVTVNVSDTVAVYGSSFKLNYDAQALEVVLTSDSKAVAPGAFFADQPSFVLSNRADAGVIEYALTLTQPAEPVSGAGVLGSITFRALKDAAVTLTPSDARLLSPEFTEVEGRRIARKINEVATQVEGLAVTVGSAPVVAVAATAVPQVVVTTAPVLAPTTAPALVNLPVAAPQPRALNPIILVGAGLFIVGLALFAVSMGAYVKLRRQYALVEQESLPW